MALLTHPGPTARIRWTLAALLRRFHPAVLPRRQASLAAGKVTAEVAEMSNGSRRDRHFYAPRRDSLFEQSAMAREMFRL